MDTKTKFFDVMVDIETTGTDPGANAIIQIAAVRFNLETRELDTSSMFNRCLFIPPRRYWDEGTREWWGRQKREILADIYSRMEDPKTVLEAFSQWSLESGSDEPMRFWGKPTHFDFSFIQNYMNQFEVYNPYHFGYATDLNSFIRGRANSSKVRDHKVEFQGDAHNAIFDVINQIDSLFKAVDHYTPSAAQAAE